MAFGAQVSPASEHKNCTCCSIETGAVVPVETMKESGVGTKESFTECDDVLQNRGSDDGPLPTIFEAAKTRKLRLKDAIQGDPNALPWIEQSELDSEARRCIRSWASGKISGQQCLLRLEMCSTVAQLLKKKCKQESRTFDSDAILWVFGCAKLGGDEPRLRDLKRDLESKTPSQLLLEAWDAIEAECGAPADRLDMDEVNLALQQLSKRARKNCSDPSPFMQVQVWRELIRLHIGAEEEADDEESKMFLIPDEDINDELMLQWVTRTDQEVREAAKAMSQKQLDREAERLLDHACRMLRLEGDLQDALEGWQKFDAYRIIGVPRGASLSEVRRAFYKRALLLHPDKGGDKDAFQELQRAYEEILNEQGAQKKTSQEEEKEEREDANRGKQKQKDKDKTDKDGSKDKDKKAGEEADKPKTADADKPENEEDTSSADASKAPEEDDGKMTLGQLATKAQSAAESAGEGATSLLRHCHAALEALEERHTWNKSSAAVESAIERGKALCDSAKLVGKHTGRIAGILEETTETNAISKEAGASTSVLEDYTKSTSEASVAVNLAASACLTAIAEVSDWLKQFENFDCDEEELFLKQPVADQLCAALKSLAENTKSVAVAALDAAETADSAVREQQQQVTEEQESSLEPPKKDESQGKPENKPISDDEEAREKEAAEAKKLLEARRALSTLLDAVRSLKRTNKGLLDLQSSGRKHAAAEIQSGATLAEHRYRAFSLLAEFLDEGALQFQEALEVALKDTHGASQADCMFFAADTGFSFLLKSSPELALPMDPKGQTLRAALAIDAQAVRDMLESQLFRRLESSLTLILLNARKTAKIVTPGLDVVGPDENAAMKKIQENLLEAIGFLQAGVTSGKSA
eukprot:gnl/MRDRNA2_/MRDRNA2_88526_c0_seq1.p1 gnl/MRDRNA2_/MRDRNA2_88526_c0~~gnl/MRDRNA2_/MRDRNA2_88526_c0_seq1.p1  ORF type:complete len:872 (+),score=239.27 gnl/MRDRNA2_/MRDRNA2_88526_c0_seq1:86-2701(+)